MCQLNLFFAKKNHFLIYRNFENLLLFSHLLFERFLKFTAGREQIP